MLPKQLTAIVKLWFDVEERYKWAGLSTPFLLWFDVEERYKTITHAYDAVGKRCGLMQKRDIRQLLPLESADMLCCGLMQKRDIRQWNEGRDACKVVVV